MSGDGATTVVIDDLDQNLVYSPISAWERSSQGQGLTGGTFAFSNAENATVTINVPRTSVIVPISHKGVKNVLQRIRRPSRGEVSCAPVRLYSRCALIAQVQERRLLWMDMHGINNQQTFQ